MFAWRSPVTKPHLPLSGPIFITLSALAAKSIFPFRICVAFVFLRPHLYFWLDSKTNKAYICVCTGSCLPILKASPLSVDTFSFSERGNICFRPNNRKFAEQEVQKYKYTSSQTDKADTYLNTKTSQVRKTSPTRSNIVCICIS